MFYSHLNVIEGASKAKVGLELSIYWFYTFPSVLVRISKTKDHFYLAHAEEKQKTGS